MLISWTVLPIPLPWANWKPAADTISRSHSLTSFLLIFHNCFLALWNLCRFMCRGCTLLLNKAKIDTSRGQDCNLSLAFVCGGWWEVGQWQVSALDHPWLWCSPHAQHRSCERERLFLSIAVVLCHTAAMPKCHPWTIHSYHKGFSAQICKQSRAGPVPALRQARPRIPCCLAGLALAWGVMAQDHLGLSRRAYHSDKRGQGPV